MLFQDAVVRMGEWYANNINTYGATYFDCPLGVGKVRADCSGYISAVLRLAGIFQMGVNYCANDFMPNHDAARILQRAGFVPIQFTGLANCKPYDLVVHSRHIECYAGVRDASYSSVVKMRSWGWGSNHFHKMPCGCDPKAQYSIVWRLNGIASDYQPPVNTTPSFNPVPNYEYSGGGTTNSFETRSGVFAAADLNTMSITTNADFSKMDNNAQHTRIYAAGQRTIKVDELSMPISEPEGIGDAQKTFMS